MKYFTIEELCRSNVAQIRNIDNRPDAWQIANLTILVTNVLDPLRERFGGSITVNSGFRSKELNRIVGGVSTSQHLRGEAADICTGTKEGNRELFEIIRKDLSFDQLINEDNYSWIHVSFCEGSNRKQILKL